MIVNAHLIFGWVVFDNAGVMKIDGRAVSFRPRFSDQLRSSGQN
jgi:hypothetical protein